MPSQRKLNFNVGQIQRNGSAGVQRAAAFIGLTEKLLEPGMPDSLTLGSGLRWSFVPDPLTPALATTICAQYSNWVIGSAFRDLDQHLSLVLDAAWDVTEAAKVEIGQYSPHHRWTSISGETNVASKYGKVMRDGDGLEEAHALDHDCLVSLSKVRNCLTHGLGYVSSERASSGSLIATWLHPQAMIEGANGWEAIDFESAPRRVREGDELRCKVEVVLERKEFLVGDYVRFRPSELLQICFFYQSVVDRICLAVLNRAQAAGVKFEGLTPVGPHAIPPSGGDPFKKGPSR